VVINANHTSETEPISLHDHLLHQPWFLHLESVTCNKTLIITTKPNVPAARAWIDANLETMIRKSILPDIRLPPSHLLPHRLDKPVHTVTSCTYTNILKQQFSLDSNATMKDMANNHPPCKRQATIIDYDSDQSTELAAATHQPPNNPQPSHVTPLPDSHQKDSSTVTIMVNYNAKLLSIKKEINSLWTIITMAVEQIKMPSYLFRSTLSLRPVPWRQMPINPWTPQLTILV